jgi:hypothetical protein
LKEKLIARQSQINNSEKSQDDKHIELLAVNAKCYQLWQQMQSKPALPPGISIKKTQFLTMMENYKNSVLMTSVAPTDRDSARSGLKKAVFIFGKVLGLLLPKLKEDADGLRCVRAYVSALQSVILFTVLLLDRSERLRQMLCCNK